jgi:hypothetical protein
VSRSEGMVHGVSPELLNFRGPELRSSRLTPQRDAEAVSAALEADPAAGLEAEVRPGAEAIDQSFALAAVVGARRAGANGAAIDRSRGGAAPRPRPRGARHRLHSTVGDSYVGGPPRRASSRAGRPARGTPRPPRRSCGARRAERVRAAAHPCAVQAATRRRVGRRRGAREGRSRAGKASARIPQRRDATSSEARTTPSSPPLARPPPSRRTPPAALPGRCRCDPSRRRRCWCAVANAAPSPSHGRSPPALRVAHVACRRLGGAGRAGAPRPGRHSRRAGGETGRGRGACAARSEDSGPRGPASFAAPPDGVTT